MNYIFRYRRLLMACLLAAGFLLPPVIGFGQAIHISGPDKACVGQTGVYVSVPTPSPVYTCSWWVTPSGIGIASGNSAGASIQWLAAGNAVIHLHGVDPTDSNNTFDATKNVQVYNNPAPFITTDLRLACQPLDDSIGREGKQPPPDFDSSACLWVCAYSTVQYTAHGSGGVYSWVAPGSVNISPTTGSTTNITWGAPGNGSVILTETNAGGCPGTSTMCVKIIEGPKADFYALPDSTAQDITICRHGTAVFIDQSISPPPAQLVSWFWDFGDGSSSSQSPGAANNPVTHQYDNPGDYTVTLTVTNSCGCSNSYSMRVHVMDENAVKIACPRVVCEGETDDYSVDKPCASQSWGVIGGSLVSATAQKAAITWDNVNPATGFGYVTYQSCQPCPMVVVEKVPVILNKGEIQGPASVCPGKQYVYRLPKWPSVVFHWGVSGPGSIDSTDQPNEIALTAGSGPDTITLFCKYNSTILPCGGSAELVIHINPSVTVSGPSLVCLNSVNNYSLPPGYSGNWTLTDPNNNPAGSGSGNSFTPALNMAGTYRLSVTASAFCPPDEFLIKVDGNPPPPDLIIGPDSACTGVPILYSAGNPVAGTSFDWTVSSGTVNAEYGGQSYITFTGSPPYHIEVFRMTTDAAHCLSHPISKTVYGPVPPLKISGEDTVCHSTAHNYALNYEDGDLYEWSVAPNTLGSVTEHGGRYDPTVLWNVPPGMASATGWLICKVRKCDKTYLDSLKVFVRGIPDISVSLQGNDTVCSGTQVEYDINSSYPITSVGNVHWEWGDYPQDYPGPGYTDVYYHTYNTAGQSQAVSFVPSVTLTNPDGCIATVSGTGDGITVLPAPVAFISPAGPIIRCGSFNIDSLKAAVTTGVGPSTDFAWTGPQSPAPGNTDVWYNIHTYGDYQVTVSNPLTGCSSKSNVVTIEERCGPVPCGPGVVPDVTLDYSIPSCGEVHITATVSGGTVVGYKWDYPTSATVNTNTSAILDVTLPVAGNYGFAYNCYYLNYAGDTCVVTKYIDGVIIPYLPDLRYSVSCDQPAGQYKVTLYDHSTVYGQVTSRLYYLYPNTTPIGSGLQASIDLDGGATYTLYEVIQGPGNPPCTSTIAVQLPDFPHAAFSDSSAYDPGCVNSVVFYFNDASQPQPLSYWWDFGDLTQNAHAGDVGKVYSAPGNPWNVTLTVTDIYGCTSSAQRHVDVRPNNIVPGNLTASPTNPCAGMPVNLQFIPGGGNPSAFTWFNGNTQLTGLISSPSYQATLPGGYWVQGSDQYGCIVNTPIVPVSFVQVPQVTISGGQEQCVNTAFTLYTQDIPTASYQWTVNGQPVGGNAASVTYTAANPGSYTFKVTIFYNGCSHTGPSYTVNAVAPLPPPSISATVLGCQPYQLQLSANGGPGVYNWNNGMSGPNIVVNHGGPYQVIYTGPQGCVSRSSIWGPKDPAEYLWIFPTGCFCTAYHTPYLSGPIVPYFVQWAWIKDGTPDMTGSGYVQDYFITPGSVYNLMLDDGNCQVESGDMYYSSDTCQHLPLRPAGDDGAGGGQGAVPPATFTLVQGNGPALLLGPNPAKTVTTALYRFGKGGRERKRSLMLYDMTGRLLRAYPLEQRQGSLRLRLQGLASGLYRVVLEADGKIIRQAKLSVAR